jgi:hypothetical protein
MPNRACQMRRFLATVALVATVAAPTIGRADEAPVIAGELRSPESAAWHAPSSSWFVSNMGGVTFDLGPDAGFGFISRIPRTGPVQAHWARPGTVVRPRGIAVSATHLFVAEPEHLVVMDIGTAQVKWKIPVPGSNADLNDVLFDVRSGSVFVSAPSIDTIFKVNNPTAVSPSARTVEVFIQNSALTQPNGLAITDGFLVSAGLGLNSVTGRGGRVVMIDLVSKQVTPITQGMGVLDGIVNDGDDFLVTEYLTGNVYRVARDGTQSIVYKLAPGTADLGIDPVRRVIMVPETLANALVTLPVIL